MNIWLIFLTGLTTGGLSCLAVQGGLLTSIIANQKENELSHPNKDSDAKSFDQLDWLPVVFFLLSKLFAYTLLGFFLGWIGGKLQLSDGVKLAFQALAAIFMFCTAMNLLNVHPIFRYLVIQPPRFVRKWLKNTSHGGAFFTPVVLGFMTVFIPCGVTQSMEVLAVSSGSPLIGALILGVFVLGTSPVFAVIGIATAKLSESFQNSFLKIAAGALILMSLMSFNGILVVMNSPVTFSSIVQPITYFFSNERFVNDAGKGNSGQMIKEKNGIQKVVIQVVQDGYQPNYFRVKAGVPVELTVKTNETYSCASSFLMKSFNVNLRLAPTDSQTVSFTPSKPGKYPFNCSMGMYRGVMEVL